MTDPRSSETPATSGCRNISQTSLRVCSLLARKIPSQSPLPKRQMYQDFILWEIGDWHVRRPIRETLFDVLCDHLKFTFGKPWFESYRGLNLQDHHIVLRWYRNLCGVQQVAMSHGHVKGEPFPIPVTGDVAEFAWLADDLYRLRLIDALPASLIHRLRSMDQFQGARYEAAVAASLARAGFRIKWIDNTSKHCEFEATHACTGETIAVEAKSRHIRGVLHMPGEPVSVNDIRFVAHRYYNQALEQCPRDKPCAIFINLNLPPEANESAAIPWHDDVERMILSLPKPSISSPALETCVVLTNFAAHYAGTNMAPSRPYVFYFPEYVLHPLNNVNTFIALIRAIETYGEIPFTE